MSPRTKVKESEEPGAAPTQPVAAPVAKKVKPKRPMVSLWPLLSLIMLVLAGASVYLIPPILRNQIISSEVVDPLEQVSAVVPTPPALKLNYTHVRQGELIQVDPANVGKDNPFR